MSDQIESTAVVPVEIAPAAAVGARVERDTFGVLGDAVRLADVISDTELVPPPLRGRPDAVVAVVLAGHELGLGPMQSLQTIDLIQGRPSLSPEGMRALVLSRGHSLIVEAGDEEATIRCHRREWPADQWSSHTFTLADAERANLLGKGSWSSYPRAMLTARATAEACRATFPDVIAGVSYTAEELGSIEAPTPPPARNSTRTPESELPGRSRSPSARGERSSAPAQSGRARSASAAASGSDELALAALEERLAGLTPAERERLDSEVASRRLPWPPATAAVMRAVVGILDAIEAEHEADR